MDSSFSQYLIDVKTEGTRTRCTTTADADPMVLAVAYLVDNLSFNSSGNLSGLKVRRFGSTVNLDYEDISVEVRLVQHWPVLEYPEHHALAARLREKHPDGNEAIEIA